jgi:hypothetical protein
MVNKLYSYDPGTNTSEGFEPFGSMMMIFVLFHADLVIDSFLLLSSIRYTCFSTKGNYTGPIVTTLPGTQVESHVSTSTLYLYLVVDVVVLQLRLATETTCTGTTTVPCLSYSKR